MKRMKYLIFGIVQIYLAESNIFGRVYIRLVISKFIHLEIIICLGLQPKDNP